MFAFRYALPRAAVKTVTALATALALAACSPTYDWREIHGTPVPFTVLMPAKPSTHAREVNLDGHKVMMTMTATEVEDTTFAVGTATLADAAQAQTALQAMKTALVRNINGTINQESRFQSGAAAGVALEAQGNGRRLALRLIARERQVYQVLVVGKADHVNKEAADTFLSSFKPQ